MRIYNQASRDKDNDNVNLTFPFGATAEFKISRNLSLASTLIFTFQDIDLPNRVNTDHFNMGVLFGFGSNPNALTDKTLHDVRHSYR